MKPPYVKILFFTLICIYNSFYFAQGCKNIYDYTGNSQEYVVPPGISSITVKMWGAGGGSGDNRDGGNGGGGAYISGILNVSPGEQLTILVGQGGNAGLSLTGSPNQFNPVVFGGGGRGRQDNRGGGSGGGYSGIFRGDVSQANALSIAAGGGGGAGSGQQSGSNADRYRGGGGSAVNGTGILSTLQGGQGGGITAGSYTGGCGGRASGGTFNCLLNTPVRTGTTAFIIPVYTNYTANPGTALSGGNAQNSNMTYGAGGGGGGYFGGEGGLSADNYTGEGARGGGGGGSFFSVPGYSSTAGNSGGATNAALGGAAGNGSDSDNNNLYGAGGGRGNSSTANTGSAGQNGRIVIIANQIAALPAITSTTQTIGVGSSTAYSNSYPNGTWSSSNTSIASVNSSGTVSGVSAGTTDITYTYTINNPNQSGCTATLSVSRSITVIQGLPVELTQFETECLADNNIAHVFWTTASENNSSYYQVQRSHDANDWQTIAEVQAAGNSTEQIYYEITEAITWRELYTYYRLMQYDMDHSVNIYGPISIQCSNHRSNFKVFPNPFSGEVNIELSDNMAIDGIRLVRPDGTLLFVAQPQEMAGQFYKVDLSHISSGAYILEAYLQGELQLRERIVKY